MRKVEIVSGVIRIGGREPVQTDVGQIEREPNLAHWISVALSIPQIVETSMMRSMMSGTRGKFDPEFRERAVRIVTEQGRPMAQVGRDLGIDETGAPSPELQNRATLARSSSNPW